MAETASIIEETFRTICDMEERINTTHDLLHAVLMMSERIGGNDRDEGTALATVAGLASVELQKVEAMRCQLFRSTHPDRERFAAEGWPS